MHDSRPLFPADPGKYREAMQQRVHERTLTLTGARMNNESWRLIDHDYVVIFKKNIQRNFCWLDVDLFRRRFLYFNAIAAADEIARSGRETI